MIKTDMPLPTPNDTPTFPYETIIPFAYLRCSPPAMAPHYAAL
jgi:hypothetical protein